MGTGIVIPWRVRNFLSETCPLLYHLAVNRGLPGNSADHWDRQLAQTWDADSRCWPTKNALIQSLTRPDEIILDVACGNGSILRHLQAQGYPHLIGLETSRYAVERLSSEGIRMVQGRLPDIPLPDASCDVVVASQVLEHIIRRSRFVQEIRRVLKPGGRSFIFVPDNCLGPIDEPEHVIKYTVSSLRKFLGRYFMIERLEAIRDSNYPMSVLFALVRKSHQGNRSPPLSPYMTFGK